MKCFYHLDREGAAECAVCGKQLCAECAVAARAECAVCARCARGNGRHGDAQAVTAGVLSMLAPGLGQFYRNEYVKAAALFILTVYSFSREYILLGLILWSIAAWDGFRTVITESQMGLSVGNKALVAGLILIFAGCLMIPGPLRNILDLDILIPAILVVFGLVLMAKSKGVERRSASIPGT